MTARKKDKIEKSWRKCRENERYTDGKSEMGRNRERKMERKFERYGENEKVEREKKRGILREG